MSGLTCPHCHQEIPLFKIGGGEKASRDLKVPFLGTIPIDPEIVQNCDRGMPFVMSYPNSEAAKAFQQIAQRCKEYIGFKEIEKKLEMEKFPYHFQKQEVKR
jgi:MinD-like ATPase involved in chromosome partitioning or flagellar assembly